MTSFVIGQRWVSDTESELGLGMVDAINNRSITLYFPIINEKRIYSLQNPPLSRIIFNKNDKISSNEGWSITIEEIHQHQGLIIYVGTRLDNGAVANLVECSIDGKMQYSQPQLRLFAGQIDKSSHFSMRYQALFHRSEQYRLPYRGLRGMRTNLIPHQLFIAQEVGQRYTPRVLLADEVGLGKTIEAGMIIHQRLLTGVSQRILIIVPSSLQHQWLVEMLRRFNLHFALFDKERYIEASKDNVHPFDTEQLVLCSLEFIRDNPLVINGLLQSKWDMLVVDEAHHLVWTNEFSSPEYDIVEQLAQQTPSVLLLTATPEQLGAESHFARLRLLDPARFHDYAAFLQEQEQFQPVVEIINALLSDEEVPSFYLKKLTEIIQEQSIESNLEAVNAISERRTLARQQLIKILMDRHGTSRILFRNTRQSIQGFPKRHFHPVKFNCPTDYLDVFEEAADLLDAQALQRQLFFQLYPEQLYQQICASAQPWFTFDPRVLWLVEFLQQNTQQKVVIICHHKKTALDLEQCLQQKHAIRAAIFHEGMSILERDRAVAYFAAQEAPSAQVLICSEIASEGRNFQFSHTIVLFDLPLNPDLLEQRIGRLDRIGQLQDIDIFVPHFKNSAQSQLANWYHQGLNAFQECCSIGHIIYKEFEGKLSELLLEPQNSSAWRKFITETHHSAQQILLRLAKGRDQLLELQSSGGDSGKRLAAQIQQDDNSEALQQFAKDLLDLIGIHQQEESDNLLRLTPSSDMLIPDFPGIPEDGFSITFDRKQALSLEDSQFITWEHPLINNGVDLLLSTDIGRCCVNLLINKTLPLGTVVLELIYVLDSQAPRDLQIQRFLPPMPIRLLIDHRGQDLAAKVTPEALSAQLKNVDRKTAISLIKLVRPVVEARIQQSEIIAKQQAEKLIEKAYAQAEKTLSSEINRLIALKRVNPAIRNEEIEWLEQQRLHIFEHILQSNLHLDSLRLIATTH